MPQIWTIGSEDIRRATATVRRFLPVTPLIPGSQFGLRSWLKLESAQRTGSFKVRGALARLEALLPEQRHRGVISASAGNHGAGLAYAAAQLGIDATVFVPSGAPAVKCQKIAGYGAVVHRTEHPGYDASEELAKAEADRTGAVYISPFDDPQVAAGNGATLALEVLAALPEVDAIVVPVGGGGLLAGAIAAVKASGRSVEVIGVQSRACPAMAKSLEEGAAMHVFEGEPTLAEGLEGGVSDSTFAAAKQAGIEVHVVDERQIARAMLAARELGLIIEGSAAAPLAWLASAPSIPGTGAVVAVVTGGNMDPSQLSHAETLAEGFA
ncbi:MAG: pyridoxal-phosphate dependent enzyme [Myxococcota bacterium]